eukprot:TRINITY_DN4234_c0_g1_i1.p1 TRINITY_DN4234_c0_g1~~TRINITY_DN4234_c0_g1_i1.p1  ORF type:complete len:385 (-),score=93.48 TRINITY_DN4234_c0_g1_i1:49-1203(-)
MSSLAFDPIGASASATKLRCEAPEFMPGSLKGDDALRLTKKEAGPLTAETLASTTMLSPCSDAADDDEEAQEARSRTSSEDSQFGLHDLEGVWLGQGSHYGNLYTVKAVGTAWQCQRSGLAGSKACRLSWDARSGLMVLAGRYTLDPAIMTDKDRLVWTRIPGKGDDLKEVVWKRHVRRSLPTAVERREEAQKEQQPSVFSREFLLFARYHSSEELSCDVGITVKASSDVQFVCPSPTVSCSQGKLATGQKKNASKKKAAKSSQRPVVLPSQPKAPAAEEFNMAEATTDLVLQLLAVKPEPKRKKADFAKKSLPWDPCGVGRLEEVHTEAALAKALAKKLVAALPAPLQAEVSGLELPLELTSQRTTKLRYEAPEFVPGAASVF